MKIKNIISSTLLATALCGCGPAKVLTVVNIKPNETAWVIPLDGASQAGQVKFNSVGFLDQKKVPAKRIMVDQVEKSTGRMWMDYEWIPAALVITVDRSLVTREWTDAPENGTSPTKQGVGVVTKDSVQLRVGLTVTASIDEDDASTYLYYHGARPLSDVMDQNIRSFAVAELTKEYGDFTLIDAQTRSTEIYSNLFSDAKTAFKAKGITIQYLGNAEGLTYADPSVQLAINRSYQASQDAKTAQMEQNATKIRNETLVMTAQAQADAAKELFAAQEASQFQNQLKIALLTAEAKMRMASNWDGKMPSNILPSDSPMLMSLGSAK